MSRDLSVVLHAPVRALRLHGLGLPATAQQHWVTDLEFLRARGEQTLRHREASIACLEALGRAAAELPGLVEKRLDEVASLATEIGLLVAREVMGAALDRGEAQTAQAAVRCLREAVAGASGVAVEVHLCPEDLSMVMTEIAEHPVVRQLENKIDFFPDATIARGVVRVECGAGRLLHDPRQVLERIAEEIRRQERRQEQS